MKTTVTNILTHRHCRYTWKGENVAELRRHALSKLAAVFEIRDPDASKNELLTKLLAKLDAMNAELELTDMING